nr:hypothetical protein [Tanacetum cinerariifolium]
MIQLSLDEELAQKLHAEELAKETARQEKERFGFNLQQESSKKQKLDEQTEEEVEAQADTNQEVEEMKLYMKIVLDEDIAIDAIPIATKPSVIVEYKIVKDRKISFTGSSIIIPLPFSCDCCKEIVVVVVVDLHGS